VTAEERIQKAIENLKKKRRNQAIVSDDGSIEQKIAYRGNQSQESCIQ
jgi:hypothetical protein